jgi:hypothetical protein
MRCSQLKQRKALFWFKVLEISVHGQLAQVAGIMGMSYHAQLAYIDFFLRTQAFAFTQ